MSSSLSIFGRVYCNESISSQYITQICPFLHEQVHKQHSTNASTYISTIEAIYASYYIYNNETRIHPSIHHAIHDFREKFPDIYTQQVADLRDQVDNEVNDAKKIELELLLQKKTATKTTIEEMLNYIKTYGLYDLGKKYPIFETKNGYLPNYTPPSLDGKKRYKIKDFRTTLNIHEVEKLLSRQPVVGAFQMDMDCMELIKGIWRKSESESEKSDVEKSFAQCVLIIGKGTENGIDYFLVKNSFGDDWGVDGFGKVECAAFFAFGCPGEVYLDDDETN